MSDQCGWLLVVLERQTLVGNSLGGGALWWYYVLHTIDVFVKTEEVCQFARDLVLVRLLNYAALERVIFFAINALWKIGGRTNLSIWQFLRLVNNQSFLFLDVLAQVSTRWILTVKMFLMQHVFVTLISLVGVMRHKSCSDSLSFSYLLRAVDLVFLLLVLCR